MIDLILIVFLVISLFRPEILLIFVSKDLLKFATVEEKEEIISYVRKVVATCVFLIESLSILSFNAIIGLVLEIIAIYLFIRFGVPSWKNLRSLLLKLKTEMKKYNKRNIDVIEVNRNTVKEENTETEVNPIKETLDKNADVIKEDKKEPKEQEDNPIKEK